MRQARRGKPVVITDAAPSLAAEQRVRKRVYAVLMAVHLAGFVAAALLAHIWWLAVVLILITVPLPWIAVVIANNRLIGGELARRWQRETRGGGERGLEQRGGQPPLL
ncbi:hypothetical protein GCM10027174_05700 [Salinifilum aidingensis]